MWEIREIEEVAKKYIKKQLGKVKGEEKFSTYVKFRQKVVEDILPEIKSIQPQLTDHGPEHVANVMDNAEMLLGRAVQKFTGIDLYCLLLSIVFHDVGNIFDRKDHQKNIGAAYDYACPDKQPNRQEQKIIMKVVSAHCGKTNNGSNDTLEMLADSHLDRRCVKLRQIASILRFADELAEGTQRTSLFMQQHHPYSQESEIYHKYAAITETHIDRGNERIALTYHIDLGLNTKDNQMDKGTEQNLSKLLKFSFRRIIKVDQERKYTKHYCDFLAPFKKTTAVFNFWNNEQLVDIGIEPITLTDLVVPGETQKELHEYSPSYRVDSIIKKIKESSAKI